MGQSSIFALIESMCEVVFFVATVELAPMCVRNFKLMLAVLVKFKINKQIIDKYHLMLKKYVFFNLSYICL